MIRVSGNFSTCLMLLLAVAMLYLPELAFAGPFGSGASALKSDLIELLTPILGIVVIGCGIACAAGKLSWWWFVGVVVGIILVFGHQQIIDWIRGLFKV
jgi:type IV secretion system protein VirB2